jgi:DNA-binding NtrC family response regulator
VDVRVIAASNRNLEKAMAEGLFRKDLYYRLNVISLHIPPLRERRDDIPFLARHFLEKYLKKHKDRKTAELYPGALELLMNYDYPGNVRELENAIDYAVTFAHGNEITENDLPIAMRQQKAVSLPVVRLKPLKVARSEFERNFITAALKECQGNISRASLLLGLQRQNLQHKIKSLGIISTAFKK